MKRIKKPAYFLLISIFLLASQFLKCQDIDWLQSNHEWYYSVDCFSDPSCGYSHFSVVNDTLLGGEQGIEVHISTLEESNTLTINSEILRFSNDTVFRYSSEAERWHMLYDLGALPGDVWNIQDEEFMGYADEGFPDSLFRVVVDSVDLMEIGGEERRVIYTSAWTDGINSSQFHFGYEGFILEGVGPVGDARSLIGQSVASSLVPHPARFQCFLNGGELVFGSPASPCNILSTETEVQPAFSLFPNPVFDLLIIELKETYSIAGSIRVLDLHGRVVQEHQPFTGGAIDVRPLPAGLYLLQIRTADGRTGVKKFVKAE